MVESVPRMIIRSNVASPDILMYQDDELENNLKEVYNEISNPNSRLFIESDYLQYR